jgi:hypothetical protein
VIAGRLKKAVREVEEILEKLAKRGFLYKQKTVSDKIGYAFIQIGFGIPQIFFWKGKLLTREKKLPGLWQNTSVKGQKQPEKQMRPGFCYLSRVNLIAFCCLF